jgi:hypothetical protein
MFSSKPKPLPARTVAPSPRTESRAIAATTGGVHLGAGVYWNPETTPNPHITIIGASGSGKTQTLKAIAWELSKLSYNIVIIDFHGDQHLPGEIHYPLNMASPHGINPLTINLDPEGGGPALQAIAVAATLKRSLQMGPNQEGFLLGILKDCYLNRGITQGDQNSWLKTPPSFADVEAELVSRTEEVEDDEGKASGCKDSEKLLLKLGATFQYGVFSRTQPGFLGGLIRIDLSKLPPEIGAIAAEAILKQLMDSHRLMGECDAVRTFTFVDEAKELKGSPSLDRVLADGRKYGLAAGIGSQSERHFNPDILANSSTKIVLAVDQTEVKKVATKFRFDEKRIAALKPLQGLVRIGATASYCDIDPYYQRVARG